MTWSPPQRIESPTGGQSTLPSPVVETNLQFKMEAPDKLVLPEEKDLKMVLTKVADELYAMKDVLWQSCNATHQQTNIF